MQKGLSLRGNKKQMLTCLWSQPRWWTCLSDVRWWLQTLPCRKPNLYARVRNRTETWASNRLSADQRCHLANRCFNSALQQEKEPQFRSLFCIVGWQNDTCSQTVTFEALLDLVRLNVLMYTRFFVCNFYSYACCVLLCFYNKRCFHLPHSPRPTSSVCFRSPQQKNPILSAGTYLSESCLTSRLFFFLFFFLLLLLLSSRFHSSSPLSEVDFDLSASTELIWCHK